MGRGLVLCGWAAVVAVLLAGCERPAWTDPARSKGPRSLTAEPAGSPATPPEQGIAPAPPPWAGPLLGRRLDEIAQGVAACQGNADAVRRRYAGPPPEAELAGWGWDLAAGRRVARVVLVDESGRIVGAGEGGRRRLDVPRALPAIPDADTGWTAVTGATGAVTAYGLTGDGRGACRLGTLQL